MPAQQYTGGCHCGQVRYDVTLDLDKVVVCNCSICTKTGAILGGVSAEQFKLNSGQDMLSDYTFNKHVIHHRFCTRCGIHTHGEGVDPKGNRMAAINIRCLEGVDPSKLKITPHDGKSM